MSPARTAPHAVVLHESMFGNTAAIAGAVATGLRRQGFEVTESDVAHASADTVEEADLLVLGAPTHALSLSRDATRQDAVKQGAPQDRADVGLREWLTDSAPTDGPAVAVFDTRVGKVRRLPSAARAAARLVRRRGLRLVAKPQAFVVEGATGPLREGELDRAQEWGRTIAREWASSDTPG